jgi:hypothetical protein
MAAKAQTRITEANRERLVRLAAETGQTTHEVLDAALERYERDLFLDQMNEGFAAVREDKQGWNEYQAELHEWDETLGDGIE